jgi:CMP-N-acetylneuraminic acid synthetase
VDWVIQAVNDSQRITHAILSSDAPAILDRATGKVQSHLRAAWAATDEASSEAVIEEALGAWPLAVDALVLVQPTSPLTEGWQIDEALGDFERAEADSLVTVVSAHGFTWIDGKPSYNPFRRPRRQEITHFEETGSFYATTLEQWKATKCRIGYSVTFYVLPDEHRRQVDTPADLEAVSALLAARDGVTA